MRPPQELRFPANVKEVRIRKQGDGLLISPVKPDWSWFFAMQVDVPDDFGQPEVGVGLHPGGGGTERLPPLVGRGRALKIVLGANDFDGDTAERYGYVNRALPDAELDSFLLTKSRCHPPTGSSTPSTAFSPR